MSDFDAINDDNHACDEACLPFVPVTDRDLEDLDESAHIDTLYDVLNLAREHAALMILAVARSGAPVQFPGRSAAVLLDLDEAELNHELGHDQPYTAEEIVNYSIKAHGDDGYVGQAMAALFRLELGGV